MASPSPSLYEVRTLCAKSLTLLGGVDPVQADLHLGFLRGAVPMTDTLAAALKAWIGLRPVQSEFVFTNFGEEKFCREFNGQHVVNRQHFPGKLCEKAGGRPFSYHAIRHLPRRFSTGKVNL